MDFDYIKNKLQGTIETDRLHQQLYATDASVYKKYPIAVCFPKSKSDIKRIVDFAKTNRLSLIPRSGGTSLAGQCVGEGIVVDVSKHMNKIIDFDPKNKLITVEPGIIRDELNDYLKAHQLFFGPNTSTSNRCTIGGMVGNNSSGTTSIQYGVTRDKTVRLECFLSDGSEVVFEELNQEGLILKQNQNDLEGAIYKKITQRLSDKATQAEIIKEFPLANVHRRNTGYAIDSLIDGLSDPENFSINLSKLLAGSEGTLAFTTAITLKLEALPPQNGVLVAAHFESISKCLSAVYPVMQYRLFTCEMMDKTILDCTKDNIAQAKNRFFIQGDPKAILLLELRNDDAEELENDLKRLINTIDETGLSYAHSVLRGEEIEASATLRKAGLGLLGNLVGDKKAVACIEDTAVPLESLSDYIAEFSELMEQYDQEIIYYAHAGAGELHLRPTLNLKIEQDRVDFKNITLDVARLVKRYKGSLSGEHGDGIVRSEFIPLMVGEKNFKIFKEIKSIFDPSGIFNPGKIVDPLPMDDNFRYDLGQEALLVKTFLDFSKDEGLLRATEKCNGSGDCRSTTSAATLCPSYRATRNEKDSTRGRANVLREVLTHQENSNPFDSKELSEVMELCIGCKACASECPSSVDVATYKAEYLYQYQKTHSPSLSDRLFAYNGKLSRVLNPFRAIQNGLFKIPLLSTVIKKSLGIAVQRSLPKLYAPLDRGLKKKAPKKVIKTVYLYFDEFTNYLDVKIGNDAYELLIKLGYQVEYLPSTESGRGYISKGFLEQAKFCAEKNLRIYGKIISKETPLIGIEPSAIYTFKDEYLKLCEDKTAAKTLASNCFAIEEFLSSEMELGNITQDSFNEEQHVLKIHAHCYQKALGNPADTFKILNLPKNHKVTLLNTGCCGMAGSFGYEAAHYEVSQKIGEERLFPAVRKLDASACVVANGTSCRHQILDGTGKEAFHPITILNDAVLVP